MVTEPEDTPLERPCDPAVSLTVATVPLEELQYAEAVISCVLLSLKVPVAVNCWVEPAAIEAVDGVTAMETSAPG